MPALRSENDRWQATDAQGVGRNLSDAGYDDILIRTMRSLILEKTSSSCERDGTSK